MFFYLSNLFILVLYLILFRRYNCPKACAIVFAIHIALLIGLRSVDTGSDTSRYWNIYRIFISYDGDIRQLGIYFQKYPGWTIVFYLLAKIFCSSPDCYMLITGIIIAACVCYIVYSSETNFLPYFLFFTLFLIESMNHTRQTISLLLLVIAYICFEKKRKIIGIILLLLAIGMHVGAILGCVIFVIRLIKWNRKRFFGAMSFLFILTLSYRTLFSLFVKIFPLYSQYEQLNYSTRGRSAFLYIINILTILYSLWIINNDKCQEEQKQILWKYNVISIIAFVIGVFFIKQRIVLRLVTFFQIFTIFHVPIVLRYRNKYKHIYSFLVISESFLYFLFLILGNHGEVVPYQTFLLG